MAGALGLLLVGTATGVLFAQPAQAAPGCHTVQIVTGTAGGAGSDENVHMTFYDRWFTPVWKKLDGAGNNFENGDRDTFTVCGVRPRLLLPVVKLRYTKRPIVPSDDRWQVSEVIVDGRRHSCRNTWLSFGEDVACA
jgi:hypothetical protein